MDTLHRRSQGVHWVHVHRDLPMAEKKIVGVIYSDKV